MNTENLNKVIELAREIRLCMLTTIQSDGLLKSRPMYLSEINEDGEMWFFNNENSCKTDEIISNPSINLAFQDMNDKRYLTISGRAEIVHDKDKMKKMMSTIIETWFPKGMDDPSLSLLKVKMDKAEYWETENSRLERLFELDKSSGKNNIHKESVEMNNQ